MNILGIDIGGTKIKYGIVKSDGSIVYFSSIDFIGDISVALKKIKRDIQKFDYKKIGIGVAGDVDNEKGIVRFSPNLNWKNYNLKKIVKEIFKKSVNIENDANAAAFGAYILDTKKKYKNMLCITLGTGVGGGIIIDGKVYRGATGTAGEFGHLVYIPDGAKCSCGNSGCFERYIGRDGIIALAKRKIKSQKSILSKSEKITPEIITGAAIQNDKTAMEVWSETGKILGILLSDVVNLLNPEAIVLTGGVSKAAKFLINPAILEMKKRAFKTPANKVKILLSRHQNHLGVVGAALSSINR